MATRLLPDLPPRRLSVDAALDLEHTLPSVTLVWPLWGYRAEHPPTVIGMYLATTGLSHLAAFDPGQGRWISLAQFDGVDVDDPMSHMRGVDTLETFIRQRYERRDLMRFDVTFEFD